MYGMSKERAHSQAQKLADWCGGPYYIMGINQEWWIFRAPPEPVSVGLMKQVQPFDCPDVIASRPDGEKPEIHAVQPQGGKTA